MIILEDVTKTYSSGVPALNGINLHVQKGEFVFIVGKSGSGKSTLIKLLLKELDPTTGKIYVNKKYLNKITRKKLPYLRRDIGVVFQDFRLLPDRNVFERPSASAGREAFPGGTEQMPGVRHLQVIAYNFDSL